MAVRRVTLVSRVADDIRGRIVDGHWPVGARLPAEAQLSTLLGVSRSTVREAIRMLQSQGLLESRHGDGTFVRASSELHAAWEVVLAGHSTAELIGACRAVEREAVRLWFGRADAERTSLPRPTVAPPNRLPDLQSDLRFHTALVRAGGNPLLVETDRQLWRALRLAWARDPSATVPRCWLSPHLHLSIAAEIRRDTDVNVIAAVDALF